MAKQASAMQEKLYRKVPYKWHHTRSKTGGARPTRSCNGSLWPKMGSSFRKWFLLKEVQRISLNTSQDRQSRRIQSRYSIMSRSGQIDSRCQMVPSHWVQCSVRKSGTNLKNNRKGLKSSFRVTLFYYTLNASPTAVPAHCQSSADVLARTMCPNKTNNAHATLWKGQLKIFLLSFWWTQAACFTWKFYTVSWRLLPALH